MKQIVSNRLVTSSTNLADPQNPLGILSPGALVYEGDTIVAVGHPDDVLREIGSIRDTVHVGDHLVTPGLVDAHTHVPFAGSRHGEYAIRMAGGDYRAIAKEGGGILASHRSIVATEETDLSGVVAERLARMATLGVTTVEAKSGYGLLPDEEEKQLRAARMAGSRSGVRVVPTLLGLHALPERYKPSRAEYVELVSKVTLPRVASLCEFVDAYVDDNAFSVDEAERLVTAAMALGLGSRVHIGQFRDVGGAELAARVGARAVDHVEHIGRDGIEALARANVFVGLLPMASFTLRQDPPPVAAMRDAGISFYVASDANPGTAPTESLPLSMALATRLYGLSVDEVVMGATRHAAASLTRSGPAFGSLSRGASADYVVWDFPHEACLIQPWGTARTKRVVARGVLLVQDGTYSFPSADGSSLFFPEKNANEARAAT